MPAYSAPTSDDARLATLETVFTTASVDNDEGRLLPAATRTAIGTFLTAYRPVVQAVTAAMAGRAKEVSEKELAKASLETHVRDFFEVLKRRTFRMKHNVSVLVHYGLPQSGDKPPVNSAADVETAAESITQGETAAVAAGFPAMANPSAAEVATALATFITEADEVTPADTEVRAAQTAAANLRVQADDLIEDAKDEITHALRKLAAPAQRSVLRRFGFVFSTNPGEVPEPVNGITAAVTPPPVS